MTFQAINNEEDGKIIGDMIAPGEPGICNAIWTIDSDSRTQCVFCNSDVITVTSFNPTDTEKNR